MTTTMFLAGAALFAIAMGSIYFLLVRKSELVDVSRREFDEAFVDVPASERGDPADRDDAWREFLQAWRVQNDSAADDWPDGGAL